MPRRVSPEVCVSMRLLATALSSIHGVMRTISQHVAKNPAPGRNVERPGNDGWSGPPRGTGITSAPAEPHDNLVAGMSLQSNA